jgi:hypothetical protein
MNKRLNYDQTDEDYFSEHQILPHIHEVFAVNRRLIATMFTLELQELTYNCNLYELIENYESKWDKYEFFTMLSCIFDVEITTEQIDILSFFDTTGHCESLVVGQWINNLVHTLYNKRIIPNKKIEIHWDIFYEIHEGVIKTQQFFENLFIVPIFIFILFVIFNAVRVFLR